ncbi:MAG TPA: hypothetical protein VK184_13990 [Nostocaceae cyanobacterium]|nr:hypothetical protein [Nostocaceae cyanobacterium]
MYNNQTTNSKLAVEISILSLVEELSDITAEKLCGGSIITPDTTAENKASATPSNVDTSNNPSMDDLLQVGLKPFTPPLPETKLSRLGPIDPANRTPTKPQSAITVTIPLPLPVS